MAAELRLKLAVAVELLLEAVRLKPGTEDEEPEEDGLPDVVVVVKVKGPMAPELVELPPA